MAVKSKAELDADIVEMLVPGTLNRVSEIVEIAQDIVDSAAWETELADVALSGDFNDLINTPSGSLSVSDATYSSDWNAVTDVAPSKNVVYDKIENVVASISGFIADTVEVNAGTGLTGGGDLSENRTISLNAGSIASLLLADSATQPGDLALVATSGSFADLTDSPVSNTVFGVGWDSDTTGVPSKNAVYDKISAMDTTISGKAATSHTHLLADVTDFDAGDYAEASHEHVLADITDFSGASYATASQGLLADTAVQPADIAVSYVTVTASRDTVVGDDNKVLRSTSASEITITVQANTVPNGFQLRQIGAGKVNIADGAGVVTSLEAGLDASTRGQYALIELVPEPVANTYILTGSLDAE
jgi:hypothetical protein